MNKPVIENLFSQSTPRPDVGLSVAGRRGDDPQEFGDHLRQAGNLGPAQSSEPWWRSTPEPRESDNRPPDVRLQPPPPPFERAPLPAADLSRTANSSAVEEDTPNSDKNDLPSEHDDEQTSAIAEAVAGQPTAKSASSKPTADKQSTSESPPAANNAAKSAANHADKATSNVGAATKRATPSTATAVATSTTLKDTTAARQASSKDTHPLAVEKDPADAAQGKSAAADPTAKPAKSDVATQQTEQPISTVPIAASVAVAVNESPTVTADKSESSDDSRPGNATDKHGAARQKQTAKAVGQVGQPLTKRSAATQATVAEVATPEESTASAAAKPAASVDEKPDAMKKVSAPAVDKSSADRPGQTASIKANTNQTTPNVAAVTTANNVENMTAKDGASESGVKVAKPTAAPKSSTLAAFGRLDRDGGLTSRGPLPAADNPDAPRVDPARFVSRVVRAIETAHDRGGPLNLRLSPPELGSMRLELSVKQGVMTAKVETDTAAARQALLDNLPTLRDRLAEQNVRIDRFDVDVRRDPGGDQPNHGPQQRQFQQHQQLYQSPTSRPTLTPTGGTENVAEPAPTIRTITDTTINLVA